MEVTPEIVNCFVALSASLFYTLGMRNYYVHIIVIFIVIWSAGVFFTYLKGMKKFHIAGDPAPQGRSALQQQRELTTETERQRKKMMEDLKYQTQKNRDMMR